MNVLLSIKPKYVSGIIAGKKRYEFRKLIWKRKDADTVFIYSSAPSKKIVGFFSIGSIIEGPPDDLWSEFKDHSGIVEDEFFNYFNGREIGFAIEISQMNVFETPIDPFRQTPDFRPPQSFCYIDADMFVEKECPLTLDGCEINL